MAEYIGIEHLERILGQYDSQIGQFTASAGVPLMHYIAADQSSSRDSKLGGNAVDVISMATGALIVLYLYCKSIKKQER